MLVTWSVAEIILVGAFAFLMRSLARVQTERLDIRVDGA
jgi:hypothetical protein